MGSSQYLQVFILTIVIAQATSFINPLGTHPTSLVNPSGTQSTSLVNPSGTQSTSLVNPSGTQSTGIKGCRPQADVIFLLDGSDSISDQEFIEQKQFVRRFVELSDVGPESIRVGLAVVSSMIGDELPLSLNATKQGLLLTLDGVSQPQEGSRTDLGLIEMEQLFSTNSRRGVARIGVIITDGRAKYIQATEGEARVVKDAGIFLIAVGVGRLIKFSELEKIASTTSNAFNLDPLDLSTRYLAETVDFQGLESCTGHLLIDKLGVLPDKNSAFIGGSSNGMLDTNGNQMVAPTSDLVNNLPVPSNTIPNGMANPSAAMTSNIANSANALLNNIANPLETLSNNIGHPMDTLSNNLANSMNALSNNVANPMDTLSNNLANSMNALSNNVANPMDTLSNNLANSMNAFSNNQAIPLDTLSNNVVNPMDTLSNNLANSMNAFSNNQAIPLDTLSNNVVNPMDTLSNNLANSMNAFSNNQAIPLDTLSNNVANPMDTLSNNLANSMNALSNNVANPMDTLSNNLANSMNALSNNVANPMDTLSNNLANSMNAFPNNQAIPLDTLSNNVANPMDTLSNNLAISMNELSNNMANLMNKMPNGMSNPFGALTENIANPANTLSNDIANPSNILSNNMADHFVAIQNNPTDSSAAFTNNQTSHTLGMLQNTMGTSGTVHDILEPLDAVRSNFAALSAALAKNSASPSVSLANYVASDTSAPMPDVSQQIQPVPQPPVEPQAQTSNPAAEFNRMNMNIQRNSIPGRVNFLGVKMDPFVNMGRFNPINAVGPGFQRQPTNPPTAPPTQPPVITTTQAPITQPHTTTTTKAPTIFAATTRASPMLAPNSLIQYQNQGSSPTEASSLMIQNLMSSIIGNGMPRVDTARGNSGPQLFDTTGMLSAADREGVGISIPGSSVAASLAFIKSEMKPPRTVEEITNPIYQMFGVSQTVPSRRTTVMTTTMSPAQIYKQRHKLMLKEQCSLGEFVNGFAYVTKPGSCTEFLKCYKEHGDVHFDVIKCPFETFFDDHTFVCRHHEEQMCWNDPCADPKFKSYSHNGNCRSFWMCQRGKSVPQCCPVSTSYVSGFGCTRNVTCSDTCMDFGDLRTVTMNSHCKLLPISGDSEGYFEYVAGMGWVVRMCAPGSHFDQSQCACASLQGPNVEVCEPELYLDFQGGIIDKSKNSLSMGIQHVDLDGGTGAFYGRSFLKLWRFSGMSLGQHVTISFRFRTSVTAQKGKMMHLVSNCCYGCSGAPKPSIDIAIIPGDNGGVAVFSTSTIEAGEMFLFVPFKDTFTGWNTLEYSYDGLNLQGTVNGQSASKKMLGSIVAKSDPLLIGSCGVADAYDGFLDEFKFYMCNP